MKSRRGSPDKKTKQALKQPAKTSRRTKARADAGSGSGTGSGARAGAESRTRKTGVRAGTSAEANTRTKGKAEKQVADSWLIGKSCDTRTKSLSSPLNSLRYHTLVCGSTGSGKTNTCFNLIEAVWKKGVPFLVIEPSKSEYRQLLIQDPELYKSVRIFTPGDERLSQFRINPFEFGKNVSVQAHIDALLSIFNSSFEMFSPMPQVLATALCAVYEEKGWDLGQNTNSRLPEGVEAGDEDCPAAAFPTMTELYDCIATVTNSFHYSEALGPDIRSALQSRIGMLLLGAKGLVFGQSKSVNMKDLFSAPAIIELGDKFNSCEESFLTGILLLSLYEFRKSQGASHKLEHVLLLEDAHRILSKDTPRSQNDPRPFCPVPPEIFSKLLSESGKYGQGIVVSSQTPNLLVPEIASNTNLKIVHRLLTGDEINSVAPQSFLSEREQRSIVGLNIGEGLVIDRAMTAAQKVQIDENLKAVATTQTDLESANKVLLELLNSSKEPKTLKLTGALTPEDFDETNDARELIRLCHRVAADPIFKSVFNNYVVACTSDLTQIVHYRTGLVHEVQRILGGRGEDSIVEITWGALVLASDRYFRKKGEDGYWSFTEVRMQTLRWLNLLRSAFLPDEPNHNRLKIEELKLWRDDLLSIQERPQGPYPSCGPCKAKCYYRFEVSEIVNDPRIRFDFNSSINRDDAESSESAAWFCQLLSERIFGKFEIEFAYCLAVQLIREQSLSTDAQLVLMHKIRTHLERSSLEANSAAFIGEEKENS